MPTFSSTFSENFPTQPDTTISEKETRSCAFDLQRQSEERRLQAQDYRRRKQGLTASYYADEANALAQRAKEEHSKAADIIFTKQNEKYKGRNIIDLHGLHVDEGLKRLKNSLSGTQHKEVFVITGRGKNSKNHNGKIFCKKIQFKNLRQRELQKTYHKS